MSIDDLNDRDIVYDKNEIKEYSTSELEGLIKERVDNLREVRDLGYGVDRQIGEIPPQTSLNAKSQVEFYTRIGIGTPEAPRYRRETNRRIFFYIVQENKAPKSAQFAIYKDGSIESLYKDKDEVLEWLNQIFPDIDLKGILAEKVVTPEP